MHGIVSQARSGSVQYFRSNQRLLLDTLWKTADFVQSERPFPA